MTRNQISTKAALSVAQRLTKRTSPQAAPEGIIGGDCELWEGATDTDGYGVMTAEGTQSGVHRLAYMALVGPIPDGLELDHLCRVRLCCNVKHLEPVTGAENRRRAAATKRHCPAGHPYSPENTRLHIDGKGHHHRHCRICDNGHRRAYDARQRAAEAARLDYLSQYRIQPAGWLNAAPMPVRRLTTV